MSDLAKKYNDYMAPEAIVWINDEKLSKHNIFFSDLKVDMTLDGADIFSFSILDAIDLEFDMKHSELFNFGDKVEIHIGYADSAQAKRSLPILFKGIITSVNWSFSENNYMDIIIEGKDYSFLLMKHKSSSEGDRLTWDTTTDSEIVANIIDKTYGDMLSNVKIEDTKLIHNQVYYQEENDYAFLNTLAKRNGYEFFVQKDELFFRTSPEIQVSSSKKIKLFYGKEILSFSPEFNMNKQVTKVRVVGVEFLNAKKKIIGEAPITNFAEANNKTLSMKELLKSINSIEYEMRASVKSVDEANKLAQSKYDELSSTLIKAELRCMGIPELKPGISIALEGLGSRFSRNYYITKAVHTFNNQGYEVSMSLTTNASIFKKV